jgi:YggT family protein
MSVVPNLPKKHSDVAQQVGSSDRLPEIHEELDRPTPEQLEIRRRARLAKWSQIITLLFAILELGILFRVVLKLIAANPASPFAQFMYQMTGPFLAPFAGLTVTPAVNGSVLEIPAIIAMAAYGVLYFLVIRVMWVIFNPAKARDAAKYEPDL